MFHGFLNKIRLFGPDGQELQKHSPVRPAAIDLLCKATEALTGAVAGCDAVGLTLPADLDTLLNAPPPVWKLYGSIKTLGVVHWQEGSVASGANVWVRVFGYHPYAKVNGTSAITRGDYLQPAAGSGDAGVLIKGTTVGNSGIWAGESYSTGTTAAKKVLLMNAQHWTLI